MYLEAKAREVIKKEQYFLAPSLSINAQLHSCFSPKVIPARDDTDYPTSLHQSSINKILLRHGLRTISGRKHFNCGSISLDVLNWKTRWANTLTHSSPYFQLVIRYDGLKLLQVSFLCAVLKRACVRLFYMHIFILKMDCLSLNSLKQL